MLESIASKLVGAGPLLFAASVYGAVAVGFLVALLSKRRSKAELQRVPYFVFTMALVVLGASLGLTGLWTVEAIAQKRLWMIVGANLAMSLGIGYGVGVIAAARARDGFGSVPPAFLALIPLLNLFLLFQPSRAAESPERIRVHALFRGGAGVAAGLVLLGAYVALSFALSELRTTITEEAQRDQNPRTGIEFLIRARGVEGTLKVMAEEGNRLLPRQVDEITRLTTLEAKGRRFTRTYVLSRDDIVFNAEVHRHVERTVCGYEPFRPLLQAGAEIEEIYKTVNGAVVGHVIVTRVICEALEKAAAATPETTPGTPPETPEAPGG